MQRLTRRRRMTVVVVLGVMARMKGKPKLECDKE
jgi:hypothetical protein